MEAWPFESTKRSRLSQVGSCGSYRRNCCHKQYATGANAMGAPGWPEFACCTASIARVRIVLMLSVSSCLLVRKVCSLATIACPFRQHPAEKIATDAKGGSLEDVTEPLVGSVHQFIKFR